MGIEERMGLCLEEVVGVKQGGLRGPKRTRGQCGEETLAEKTVASPNSREKTSSERPKLGLVGKQPFWKSVSNLLQRVSVGLECCLVSLGSSQLQGHRPFPRPRDLLPCPKGRVTARECDMAGLGGGSSPVI